MGMNNMFKYATKELSQDAFICWLINYINTDEEEYKSVAKDFIELIASKIRALYQRSKGRDLYDIFLAIDYLHWGHRVFFLVHCKTIFHLSQGCSKCI